MTSADAREHLEAAIWRELSAMLRGQAMSVAVDNLLATVDNYAAERAAVRARMPAAPPDEQPTTTQAWQAAQRRALLAHAVSDRNGRQETGR